MLERLAKQGRVRQAEQNCELDDRVEGGSQYPDGEAEQAQYPERPPNLVDVFRVYPLHGRGVPLPG